MPIKIPNALPARATLEKERVPLITSSVAEHQDIRPLRVAMLNLMPDKISTETQVARLLGQTPLHIELTLIVPGSHTPKTASKSHLEAFYQSFLAVKQEKFDGLIITGAPIERLDFKKVTYWKELTEILDWSRTNTTRLFCICWGAQAALHHFYGLDKYELPSKAFGVFRQKRVCSTDYLLRGLADRVNMPVSRYTSISEKSIRDCPDLEELVSCPYTGPSIVISKDRRNLFAFNHVEYDSDTLKREYLRDIKKGPCLLPQNYFIDDDSSNDAVNSWRSSAHLLFRNWIDDIYQATPYHLNEIGTVFLNRHLK